jgi:hypothetical protein
MSEIKFPESRRDVGTEVFGFGGCSRPTIRLGSVSRETRDKGTAIEDRATTVLTVTPERFQSHGPHL